MTRSGLRAATLAVAVTAAACTTGPAPEDTVERFLEAVQAGDARRLYCLLAGASESTDLGADEAGRRRAFEAWADERFAAYETARDTGGLDAADDPLVLAKILALGKGTWFRFLGSEPAGEGGRTLRMGVRMAYDAVDLSRLSPGTTFYLAGAPLGRVLAVRVPASGEVTEDVLDEVALDWTLVREPAAGGCPAGWAVAGVRPVDGTVTTQRITWQFG